MIKKMEINERGAIVPTSEYNRTLIRNTNGNSYRINQALARERAEIIAGAILYLTSSDEKWFSKSDQNTLNATAAILGRFSKQTT